MLASLVELAEDTHMKTLVAVKSVTAALFAFGLASAQAGNIALGKEKADQACAACHGADGVKTIDGSYPVLAGQYEDFLAKALSDYKSGARKNAIMSGMAAALTKEDIANLAAYYSSLPGPLKFVKR